MERGIGAIPPFSFLRQRRYYPLIRVSGRSLETCRGSRGRDALSRRSGGPSVAKAGQGYAEARGRAEARLWNLCPLALFWFFSSRLRKEQGKTPLSPPYRWADDLPLYPTKPAVFAGTPYTPQSPPFLRGPLASFLRSEGRKFASRPPLRVKIIQKSLAFCEALLSLYNI